MALVAEKWGLIPELQGFAKAGKPVWGTCAGMIFLAERAEGEACRKLAGNVLHLQETGGACRKSGQHAHGI
jgi:glutamine amidotransferase PdxT